MLTAEFTLINVPFAMGLFALFVVGVSLLRFMSDREFYRLTAMKRFWGRKCGIALHFTTNVCLPLIFGVVFLTQGIVHFSDRQNTPQPHITRSIESFVSVESRRVAILTVAVVSADFLHWNEYDILP